MSTVKRHHETDETSSTSKVAKTGNKPAKNLYLYVARGSYNCDPLFYSVESIGLSKLFSCKHHDNIDSLLCEPLITSQETWNPNLGIGMAVASDSYLYVSANGYPDKSRKMFKFRLDTCPPQLVEDDHLNKINWIKIAPIVVEIKQRLYFLSNHASGVVDLEAFELYDLKDCKWKTLPPPPCMKDSWFTATVGAVVSHFVYDRYLCVSTSTMSCAFDTEKEVWEYCHLFSDYYAKGYPMSVCANISYTGYLQYISGNDEASPPFPAIRNVLVYGEYLLCNMSGYSNNVVAFKIEKGKVLGKPEVILQLTDQGKYETNTLLIDLGDGEFCLCIRNVDELIFYKFKVAKSGDGRLSCTRADVNVSTVQLPDMHDNFMEFRADVAF